MKQFAVFLHIAFNSVTLLLENVVVCVVGRRLDRQQVEDGVEYVMLLQHWGQVAFIGPEILRGPYQERYLVLLLGCQPHGQAMHEHLVLTK